MKKLFIKHRVNRIEELQTVTNTWGVEIDLRSDVCKPGALQLAHDPWTKGAQDFDEWLQAFKRKGIEGPIILNTKEDGLEATVLSLLEKHQVQNSFFLDTALPTLIRWTTKENRRDFALRVSNYEDVTGLRPLLGKTDWFWIDCFGGEPLPVSVVKPLKEYGKICLVSPELQGMPVESVDRFDELFEIADAVCTKRPEVWGATAH